MSYWQNPYWGYHPPRPPLCPPGTTEDEYWNSMEFSPYQALPQPVPHPSQTMGLKPSLRCELCGVSVNSEKIMQSHLEGRAHQRRLANSKTLCDMQKEAFKSSVVECDICNISVNSQQQLEIHKAGAKHKKIAASKNQKSSSSTSSTSASSTSASSTSLPHFKSTWTGELPNDIIRIDDPSKKVAGSYKCKACDCLLNSEVQMRQVRQLNRPFSHFFDLCRLP